MSFVLICVKIQQRDDLMVDTAKALRIAMFNNNEMTPTRLCKAYGCGKANMSIMRNSGVKNLDAIEKLCEIFGIKVSDFMLLGESNA